jgi:hypothetical protein
MHSFTSGLDGGEWSASRLGPFTLREGAPGIRWIGGWVSPRTGLLSFFSLPFPKSLFREGVGTYPGYTQICRSSPRPRAGS